MLAWRSVAVEMSSTVSDLAGLEECSSRDVFNWRSVAVETFAARLEECSSRDVFNCARPCSTGGV